MAQKLFLAGNPLVAPTWRSPRLVRSFPGLTGPVRLSAVCVGNQMVDLTTGVGQAVAGNIVGGPDGRLGPAMLFTGSSLNFGGKPGVVSSFVTMAFIFTHVKQTLNQTLFATSTSGGYAIEIDHTSGQLRCSLVGVFTFQPSGIAFTDNVPYFLAISFAQGATINYVMLRLDNGQIITQSQNPGGNVPGSDGTSYGLGDSFANGNTYNLKVASALYAPSAASMPQLLAVAAEPWSLWYPSAPLVALSA